MTATLAFVVDASVTAKTVIIEPLTPEAKALFALLAIGAANLDAPDLIYAECANILWKQVQRGGVTPAEAASHLATITAAPLQITPTLALAADALQVALAHGISAYDACYVALAQRLGIPLITADQRLVNKLTGTAHAVIWLGAWVPPVTP
jgi:predicted nucleic acid-binding protein